MALVPTELTACTRKAYRPVASRIGSARTAGRSTANVRREATEQVEIIWSEVSKIAFPLTSPGAQSVDGHAHVAVRPQVVLGHPVDAGQ